MNQLRLGVDTKFVLAYFPPYAEHGILSWQEHGLILEQFIQAFVAIKMPLVLSLHPASAHDYYKKLEERYSFLSVSSESRLIDCYALAECVVLPASSNTLELITYFDIPAVIYDFIGVVDKTDGSFIAATNVGTAFVCSIGDMVEEIHKCLLRPKLDNEAKFKVNFTQKPACNFILETIENKLLYFREVKK